MRVKWLVSVFAHEQTRPDVWTAVVRATDAWNADSRTGRFDTAQPFLRTAVLEDPAARNRLVDSLEDLGAVVHADPISDLEESDLAQADFIGVFARASDLDVVTNAEQVLTPTGPCPECGLEDSFDVRRLAPFVIDAPPHDVHWLNLPDGGLAVSASVLRAWAAAGVDGFDTEPLLDAESGEPSPGWRQLVARTVVLVPCTEHTVVDGAPFCPACGRAHGFVEGAVRVRSDHVEGVDVLSRHPGGVAMLYLSRRAYDPSADTDALDASDVLLRCAH
jgi:hypothetical protein